MSHSNIIACVGTDRATTLTMVSISKETTEKASLDLFMAEGQKALSEHPCEALVKTNVLYNGKAVFLVRFGKKCGIMDATGNMIVPAIYDGIIAPESYKDKNTFCVDSYFSPKREHRNPWGAIKLDGTQITELFSFYYMFGFKNGKCIVKMKKTNVEDYAIIDTEGEYLIPFGVYTNMYYTNGDKEVKALSFEGEEVRLNAATLEKL